MKAKRKATRKNKPKIQRKNAEAQRRYERYFGNRLPNTKQPNEPQFWQPGRNKYGDPIPELEEPKKRLSVTEAKVLALFIANKIDNLQKAVDMKRMLELYREKWPKDNFIESKMSRDLAKLKKHWFLSADKGPPMILSEIEQRYMRKKTLYWLSDKHIRGEISTDGDRWVILNGEYIATEKVRKRTKLREVRRAGANG
ncbi:hypothetical protein [Candidatus Nitrososphaera sp. FF02]|uniref:hypothetical protein n=1 Tax=Candidatus Nitrososphaera sp. FF02 TaxID=3398226 RepID=UPI0039EA7132